MKSLYSFCLIASIGMLFTNCQKKQTVYSIAPPVSTLANSHTTKTSESQVSTSHYENLTLSPKESENVSDIITYTPETETHSLEVSTKDVPTVQQSSRIKKSVNNPKVRQLLEKVEITKDATGNYKVIAKEGKKLNMVERMVVKKTNQNMTKPNKSFNDFNKYLRFGIIVLAGAIVLSIFSVFVPFIWILSSLAWLGGAILFWYGLGIELDWWKEL